MKVKMVAIEDVVPYARNPRKNMAAISKVSASLKEFGWQQPVVVDKDMVVIAGHTRLEAARTLDMKKVPVQIADKLTDAQVKAYRIADNRVSQEAEWDIDLLKLELSDLDGLDYDLLLTGFDDDELNGMLIEAVEEGLKNEDEVPSLPEQPVSVLGDVWTLGNHRLMCGDSTSVDEVEKLIDGKEVDCVYTDPPYGISIVQRNKVGGGGAFGGKKNEKKDKSNFIQSSNFAPVANDDSTDVAVEAIQVIQTLDAKVEIIWGGNYYAQSLPNSSCWIVWDKKNSGNFADCELAWTNQKTAVRKFEHMWNGMVKASEHKQKRVHPTQKPIALAEWCFDEYAKDCKIILDMFGGSGSTLIACEIKNKEGFIMELSEAYVDVIINRWQDFTGKEAVHAETGKTYNEMKAERDGGE